MSKVKRITMNEIDLEQLILRSIPKAPYFASNQALVDLLQIKRTTLRYYLQKLMDLKLVSVKKVGRKVYYQQYGV